MDTQDCFTVSADPDLPAEALVANVVVEVGENIHVSIDPIPPVTPLGDPPPADPRPAYTRANEAFIATIDSLRERIQAALTHPGVTRYRVEYRIFDSIELERLQEEQA